MSNEELVKLIRQGMDPVGNMEQLYIKNQGIIFSMVKKYRYACQSDHNSTPIIELNELMHEAYFGLVKAVENYDASQGVLFMSYAPYWIRQAVKRFLDDSGRVIRVPVHKQAQVYQYNQVTAYFLQNFNRFPLVQEYARWLHVSEKAVEQLQQFMSRGEVRSLDYVMPGTEDEDITVADSVASDVDIESEVVERVSQEQLKSELWDMVREVLQHDKMTEAICYRFKEKLTLEESAIRMGITRELVRVYEGKALRRLRCNSRSKRLINYLVA